MKSTILNAWRLLNNLLKVARHAVNAKLLEGFGTQRLGSNRTGN